MIRGIKGSTLLYNQAWSYIDLQKDMHSNLSERIYQIKFLTLTFVSND